MPPETDLAARTRTALVGVRPIREVKMFGGIGFMLNGNLVAAASRRGLLLRVGKEHQREALSRSGSRPMVMRGRTMEGYIYVDPPFLTDPAIREWLRFAVEFVRTLPRKVAKSKPARKKSTRK